jgi:streptogramin lyase
MSTSIGRALPWPSWRWLACAVALGVAVALIVPALGQTINGKRLSTSPHTIDTIGFDSSSRMWAKTHGTQVVMLDGATDQLTVWSHPNAAVFGSFVGPAAVQGTEVWTGCGQYNCDHINRLDTTNGQVTSWNMPSGAVHFNIAFDSAGNAWFGKTNSKVARLNPGTNTLTEWTMPTAGSYSAQVIGVDATNRVYICEPTIKKFARLDPSTNTVTEWNIAGANNFNTCWNRDADDNQIWFSRSTTEVLRLDPATNELKIWACQIGCGAVSGVSQESAGKVWFGESGRVNSLDTTTNAIVTYSGTGCSISLFWVDPAGNVWDTAFTSGVCRWPQP